MNTNTPRVGPRMLLVLRYAQDPITQMDLAVLVGPHQSKQYGHAIVRRAVAAGLLRELPPLPGRRGIAVVAVAV